MSNVVHTDSHNGPDGYQVRSLYFDSLSNRDFQEKEDGLELRRKFRLRNQVVSTLNYNFQEVGNVELTVQSLSPHIILDQIMITVGEEVPFYEFPVQMK